MTPADTSDPTAWLVFLAPVLVLGGLALLMSSRIRLVFLVLGGLVVLETSAELGSAKVVYLVGTVLAAAGVLIRLRSFGEYFRSIALPGASLLALASISFVVAIAHGNSLSSWLRDVSPLLLLACAFFFVLDVVEAPIWVFRIFLVAGLVAAVAFSIHFSVVRGYIDSHVEWTPFYSFMLPGALFSYASAAALYGGGNRLPWTLTAASVMALMMVSGARGAVAFLVAPLCITFVVRGLSLRAAIRLVMFLLALLVLAAITVLLVGKILSLDLAIFLERLARLVGLFKDPWRDASMKERLAQTLVLYLAFSSSPIFGMGPGRVYQWRTLARSVTSTYAVVDSPLVFPVKYGLVGLVLLLLAVFELLLLVRRLIESHGFSVPRLALLGYIGFAAAEMLVAAPLEDKGLAFGMLFLLSLSLPQGAAALEPTEAFLLRLPEASGEPARGI